ncbi:hypothetical protein FPCIR_5402 [Fusarium pseudocircinatum]|uniref:Uncharacterized protein n=1 Tax=Fusarium pseudocircinatum TaxID=56676 RepID=A0A8H5PAB8_9HYPO|nr:hypothetical protein FPCIR_5402 [Fusarium pseudocircinatum]
MSDLQRRMSYELLAARTPGLKFPFITTPVSLPQICATVFCGSDGGSKMTKAELEDIICHFLIECNNHFHRLTICPIHDPSGPACACQEKTVQYCKHIASSLEESWARSIDPEHVRAIVEATLSARAEAIKENSSLMNDIRGAKSLILLNAHILFCSFATYKNGHSYDAVHRLYWSVDGALDSQAEATKRKETLLKQRQAKQDKSASGAGNTSAADSAVPRKGS